MGKKTVALKISKGGKWYALFLAILPVVMMYRFPGLEMGLTTVLVAVDSFPNEFLTLYVKVYVPAFELFTLPEI